MNELKNELKAAALAADLVSLVEDHAQAILDAIAEIRADLYEPPRSAVVESLPLQCSSCEYGELVGTNGSIACSIHGITHVNATACRDHPTIAQENSRKCEQSRAQRGPHDVPTTERREGA